MLKFSKTSNPDTQLYNERLNERGFIYFDKDKAKAINQYNNARKVTNYELAKRIILANSSNICKNLDEEYVLNYLENFEHCPSYRFNSRKTRKGYTLDMKKVLRPLYAEGYATEFLEPYITFKSLKSKCSKIDKICDEKLRPLDVTNRFGDNLYALDFTAEQQVNLRFNYNNYDIITIPKEYNNVISCPDGYFLAWGDFAQSDLRIAYNLFIRDSDNAKIMDRCTDKYEGIARIVAKYFNEEFDIDKFKEERSLYKEYVLTTINGGESSSTAEGTAFVKKFREFLTHCPRYMEYKRRLSVRYRLGLPLQVTSYFGHMELVTISSNERETTNFALNSPLQTGTSEIMILLVNTLLDKFYSLGYTSDDIDIYYARHDEPVFLCKDTIIKDAWVFKECSEIYVDNWTPLQMDFDYGYRYQESDKLLNDRIQNVYLLNDSEITQLEKDSNEVFEYYPIARTCEVNVFIENIADGKTIITIYNADNNTFNHLLAGTNDVQLALNSVVQRYGQNSEKLLEKYNGLLLYNNVENNEEYFDGLYIRARNEMTINMERARILSILYRHSVDDFSSNSELTNLYERNKYWIDKLEKVNAK